MVGTFLTTGFEDVSLNCVIGSVRFFFIISDFDHALATPILGLQNRDILVIDLTLSQLYTQKEAF